ncbi:hypothetical protein [Microbulbifer hydrolyticus]|uniref:FeoB-associated Cys-rich membrane protein n=1 Tax=Microbulbifer hydrolyticus TaxID=48074 RepID=A0ABX6IUT6_9GAMM|nr:hypothetical protein [Microbulbifer hydrolyticus]QHQ38590.1 hypothetical protein GTQ55_06050 [Microbulbifer hydrolyticus]QHQ38594.1 hypothetical protein GTQ55_06070 [Microbulbifer hydrolyticus]QHQ38616.1 hypothetical protein GTQ55_06180 [Microbulbifer hydrolyticus]
MSEQEIAFLLVGLFVLLCVAFYAHKKRSKPCEKCGDGMFLAKLEDPAGINVKPKITLSLYAGPRKYKETWQCKNCGEQKVVKYWGS